MSSTEFIIPLICHCLFNIHFINLRILYIYSIQERTLLEKVLILLVSGTSIIASIGLFLFLFSDKIFGKFN